MTWIFALILLLSVSVHADDIITDAEISALVTEMAEEAISALDSSTADVPNLDTADLTKQITQAQGIKDEYGSMISSDAFQKVSSIIERLDTEIKKRAEAAQAELQEQQAEEQKQAEEAAKAAAPPAQTAPPTTPPSGGTTQEGGTLDNAINSVKAKPVQSGLMIVSVIVVIVLAFMLGKNALKGRKESKATAGKDRMGESIDDLNRGQVGVNSSGEAVINAGSRFRGRG